MLGFIHTRMSVGARLGLIAALLIIPIIMLAGLFVVESLEDIEFAQKERHGIAYIDAVWPAFEVEEGATAPALDAVRAKYDAMFGTAEQSAVLVSARDPGVRRAAGEALLVAIADASNLTLDPDLDSYYVMDLVVLRLPAIHESVSRLADAVSVTGEGREAALAVALDHVATASAGIAGSVASASNANAEGVTAAALEKYAAETKAAVDALVAQAQSAPVGAELSEATFDTHADALWHAAAVELDRLLAQRIARLESRLTFWLAAVGAVLAVAVVLIVLISGAISSRIAKLVSAMGRLAQEDSSVDVPCRDDRNETGKIAEALVVFKASLQERLRLRAEADSAHQRMSDLARELEEKHQQATEELAFVVNYVKEGLTKLYEGDLTYRLKELFPVDYKTIRMDFNQTAHQLESAMIAIRGGSHSMRGSAEEISVAADDLSRRTEQQAAGLEETAAALEQITSTVKQNAENARRMRTVSMAAGEEVETSGAVLRDTVVAMAKIEKSSDEIARILGVIDEIAFQTNLLALNAGVEAARAGEAGRGFAVVATEVRALAQRSSEAAKEIKDLITQSAEDVDLGVKLVGKTAGALESIATRITEMNGLVATLALSAEEEARGVGEVNIAVNQMDQITQQNAAMVEQSTAASHSLAAEAKSLADIVSRFRVGETATVATVPTLITPLKRAS